MTTSPPFPTFSFPRANRGPQIMLEDGFMLEWQGDDAPTKEQILEAERDHYRQRVRQLTAKPAGYASVLDVGDKWLTCIGGSGDILEVAKPPNVDWKRGQEVALSEGPVVRKPASALRAGPVCTVRQVLDADSVEIEAAGGKRVVFYSGDPPKPGDRVLLGVAAIAIARNLGQEDTSRVFTAETGVSWENIGGQADAKRALVEAIEEPFTKKDVYERYGMRGVKGVLLWGPPGNGKTMMGKAAATALARIHGASARSSGFIYVKGPDILNKFVGESEANIRAIFSQARAHKEATGYPAIVFIDEADAVLGKRGETRWEGMERTIVPMFLAEMDGLTESAALVLLATNRADALDPAVVRDGRIDRKVHVRRPTKDEVVEIFDMAMKGRPMKDGAPLGELAAAELFAPGKLLYKVLATDGKHVRFPLSHLVSGAMVVGLAERATQSAVRREIEATCGYVGVTEDDVMTSVADLLAEQRGLNHANELREVIDGMADTFLRVERVKA